VRNFHRARPEGADPQVAVAILGHRPHAPCAQPLRQRVTAELPAGFGNSDMPEFASAVSTGYDAVNPSGPSLKYQK
jgi:hypothetical protein